MKKNYFIIVGKYKLNHSNKFIYVLYDKYRNVNKKIYFGTSSKDLEIKQNIKYKDLKFQNIYNLMLEEVPSQFIKKYNNFLFLDLFAKF